MSPLSSLSPSLKRPAKSTTLAAMSTVKEIETALTRLPLEEMEEVRDWLDEFIEDQLEVSDEFKAKIQRAKHEIAAGMHSRVRQPGPTQ